MSEANQRNQEFARKLLKIALLDGSKMIFRRAGKSSDTATELLHETGTTDAAIGDATAEIMLTTMGKIPNEMFYLEDTAPNMKVTSHKFYRTESPGYAQAVAATTQLTTTSNEYTSHSSVLLALLTALLIILLLCCTTACLIAKSKRKSSFFGKADMECDPGCSGISQPLLDKISDSTNKTSISSLRN